MAIYDDLEEINLGSIVNDGTGDDLRTAFEKVKTNFERIYSFGNAPTTASNVGTSGTGVFNQKTDNNFEFRNIQGLKEIKLTLENNVIKLAFNPTETVDFNGQDIENIGSITADTITASVIGDIQGNLVGLVRSGGTEAQNPFVDVSLLNRQVNTFDYGFIAPMFTDPISYLLFEQGTDMGTIVSPNPISIDAGTIV